ncbi:MAG: RNHCP domain-containing protein [Lawsonibacter sp.]|nr:RNHCP domain-containing protein [Lawsonibacter sp.]
MGTEARLRRDGGSPAPHDSLWLSRLFSLRPPGELSRPAVLDEEPGDRASDCGGIMEPIGVWVRKGGEWAVIHRCRRCGKLDSNRIAADDNPMKLMSIALKPLTLPPFPLEHIEKLTALMGGSGSLLE